LPLRVSRDLELDKKISGSSSNTIPFDDVAFEILFRTNFNALCAYCQFKFGFSIDQAKEAVHSGFVKLWENRETLSADLSIKAYLHKCITNTCLDILRHEKIKHRHEQFILQKNQENSMEFSLDGPDLKYLIADIDRAITELPDQMRKIFELSRYKGLKYAEISAQLNISVKTVETQMSRALVKLRQKLSHYLPLFMLLCLRF
jgi:RNA polymerase sigma-70 factor, ECF subfamily